MKTHTMKKNILSLLIAFFVTNCIVAQEIKEKSILVEKVYNTDIYQTNALYSLKDIVMPEAQKKSFVDSLRYLSAYTPQSRFSITPLSYNNPQDKQVNKGLIHLSKGNMNQLTGELSYTFQLDNYFDVTIDLEHFNWNDKTVANKFVSQSGGALSARYYLTKDLLTTFSLQNNQLRMGLFGSSLPVIEIEDVRNINTTVLEWSIQNFSLAPKLWQYGLCLEYTSTGIDKASEHVLTILPTSILKLNGKTSIKLEAPIMYSTSSITSGVSAFSPSLRYRIQDPTKLILIGVRTNVTNTRTSIFPSISAEWKPSETFTFRLKADQLVRFNNFQSTSIVNGYINHLSSAIGSVGVHSTASTGASIRLSTPLSLDASLTYDIFDRVLNFVPSTSRSGLFDGNTLNYHQAELSAAATYRFGETNFSTSLRTLYRYVHNNNEDIYNLPTWLVTPSFAYNALNDKLHFNFRTDIVANAQQADIPFATISSGIRKNMVLDISFNIKNNVRLYINGDNLLNDQYTIWHNYAVFGRSFSGGAKVAF